MILIFIYLKICVSLCSKSLCNVKIFYNFFQLFCAFWCCHIRTYFNVTKSFLMSFLFFKVVFRLCNVCNNSLWMLDLDSEISLLPTPVESRPPHPERGHTPNPTAAMFPSSPGGEGGSSADPFGQSMLPATPRRTPHHLSPSRAESRLAMLHETAGLPATPSLAPCGSASMLTGKVVGAAWPAVSGPPLQRQQLAP